MNYKNLKRAFALSMAVLLSVPTSVCGGTIEVHAAEVISDNLSESEVADNLSLEENTEKKEGTQDAGADDSHCSAPMSDCQALPSKNKRSSPQLILY